MRIFKNVLLLIVVLVLSYLASKLLFEFYSPLFGGEDGLFATYDVLASFVLAFSFSYIFFLLLFFTAFGDKKKYLWIGTLLIPALIFELIFFLSSIYIPILFGLIGWVIGFGISKLIANKKQKSNT